MAFTGIYGHIFTAHAQKLLFPNFRLKFWHRHYIQQPALAALSRRTSSHSNMFVFLASVFSLLASTPLSFKNNNSNMPNDYFWPNWVTSLLTESLIKPESNWRVCLVTLIVGEWTRLWLMAVVTVLITLIAASLDRPLRRK